MSDAPVIRAFAPGRVNIIGGHTDYTGGVVLSMAIELGTTFELRTDPTAGRLVVISENEAGEVSIDLERQNPGADGRGDPDEPAWGRLLRAVVERRSPEAGPLPGGTASLSTTLPIGAGLSSSAAFTVAADLALRGHEHEHGHGPGHEHEHLLATARRCQRAEQAATGVPIGLMDQITSLGGQEGHALFLDCTSFAIEHVPLPDDAVFLVAHCGAPRRLAGSAYATRRAECEAAAALIGPLAQASTASANEIEEPTLRRRARHVVSENARVRAMTEALTSGDLRAAGRLMDESHASLAGDFDVSIAPLDELVKTMCELPGVLGARLTGAGWGGCAIALAERTNWENPQERHEFKYKHWVVGASSGAWRRTE